MNLTTRLAYAILALSLAGIAITHSWMNHWTAIAAGAWLLGHALLGLGLWRRHRELNDG